MMLRILLKGNTFPYDAEDTSEGNILLCTAEESSDDGQ
jgi:hypothetical protein